MRSPGRCCASRSTAGGCGRSAAPRSLRSGCWATLARGCPGGAAHCSACCWRGRRAWSGCGRMPRRRQVWRGGGGGSGGRGGGRGGGGPSPRGGGGGRGGGGC